MKDDPLWIDVSAAMQPGGDETVMKALDGVEVPFSPMVLGTRIGRLRGILEVDVHVEEVTGEEMTTDVVVEIFNRVNSGGAKLSKGDLALARICAAWPDARDEMRRRLNDWRGAGFSFSLDWRSVGGRVDEIAVGMLIEPIEEPGIATDEGDHALWECRRAQAQCEQ